VRAIIAARREATAWRQTILAATPNAFWSYLRRYPRGPHAAEARRELAHLAAAAEPPPSFIEIGYDVPPPLPVETIYLERPYVYFADPVYALPPPPVLYQEPAPAYLVSLPPPAPPVAAFVLPLPIYYPLPVWCAPPPYVVTPPANVISLNIHNTVIVDPVAKTVIVTDAAGHRVPPPAEGLKGRPDRRSALAASVARAAVTLPTVALHPAKIGHAPAAIAARQALPMQPSAARSPLATLSKPPISPTPAPPHPAPRISSSRVIAPAPPTTARLRTTRAMAPHLANNKPHPPPHAPQMALVARRAMPRPHAMPPHPAMRLAAVRTPHGPRNHPQPPPRRSRPPRRR
jgi:hypothetical protein